MLVTPKKGTACLTFTVGTVAAGIIHLTNSRRYSSNGRQRRKNLYTQLPLTGLSERCFRRSWIRIVEGSR